jgi:hypothetical protein
MKRSELQPSAAAEARPAEAYPEDAIIIPSAESIHWGAEVDEWLLSITKQIDASQAVLEVLDFGLESSLSPAPQMGAPGVEMDSKHVIDLRDESPGFDRRRD